MKPATLSIVAAAALVLSALASPVLAWGLEGHTLIVRCALQMLPAEMRPFYEANQRYVEGLVMLPDDWRETHRDTAPEHYCDMDKLDTPPFANIRAPREEVEKRFGKDKVLEMGVLPWVIEERIDKLVAAFKAADAEEITVQSALLAHYIGDAHVPFHASKDWDGKTPEAKGLHFRWESNLLVQRLKPESVRPTSPARIDKILPTAFDWLADSYAQVDAICAAEDAARAKDPGHTRWYYDILSEKTLAIAEGRLTRASADLAGAYIAAWEQAGKPKLDDKPAAIYWGH